MRSRFEAAVVFVMAIVVAGASDCSGAVSPPEYDFDSTQQEQIWAFVTNDPTGRQIMAKVRVRGCTQSQCTSATLESVPPWEWGTPVGNCTMRWHISGQFSGDLVSFTLNGSDCETTVQGRSGTGGRLNGKFGTATGTVGPNTMTWNGFSTLFGGQPQPFNGSGFWVAFRCGVTAPIPCEFPVP